MEYPIIEKMFEDENPKTIIEIGCARGDLLKDYADKNNVQVSGIELFDEYKEDFEKNHTGKFYKMNALITPWQIEEHFDIAFTVGFFSILVADAVPVLKEMLRIADKVILAEMGDATLGEAMGISTSKEISNDLFPVRTTRDFDYIINKLGRRVDITQFGDKWIIKT